MIVIHIISVDFNAAGKRFWSLYEVDMKDIREVVDFINTGSFLFCWHLQGRAEEGVFEVRNTRETTIQADEIYKIQTPTYRVVRYEDSAEAGVVEPQQITDETGAA